MSYPVGCRLSVLPLRGVRTLMCPLSTCLLLPITFDSGKICPSYLVIDDSKYLGSTIGKQPMGPLVAFIWLDTVR
jgi:hypothetical protein